MERFLVLTKNGTAAEPCWHRQPVVEAQPYEPLTDAIFRVVRSMPFGKFWIVMCPAGETILRDSCGPINGRQDTAIVSFMERSVLFPVVRNEMNATAGYAPDTKDGDPKQFALEFEKKPPKSGSSCVSA